MIVDFISMTTTCILDRNKNHKLIQVDVNTCITDKGTIHLF